MPFMVMDSPLQLSLTIFSCILALLIFFHFHKSKRSRSTSKDKLCNPPQVGGALPIIGHMHLLASGNRLIHKILGDMVEKYGSIFTIRLGFHRVLVLSNSEMAKECFTTHDKVFANRPCLTAARILGYDYAMFGFASYGPYWREVRKIVSLELLSACRLDMLEHIRGMEVKRSLRELYEMWTSEKNEDGFVLVDLKQWFGDLTDNVVVKMVGGQRYFGKNNDCDQKEAERYQKAMRDFVHLSGTFMVSDFLPQLGWLDYFMGSEKQMKRTAKELDNLIEGWLEEHKRSRVGSEDQGKFDNDFMDAMLNILEGSNISGFDADTIIKATCLQLIVAGSDTMMVTLTWALSLLLNNCHVLRKAQDELDNHVGKNRNVAESDIKNLVYLQAIVKETLRLYPATPLISLHCASEDCKFLGYNVSAGTRLIVNLWKIQRDPRIWTDPLEFKPERFMTSHAELNFLGQSFEYIPFGSGRRSCPGTLLAVQVVHLGMASLLHCFELKTQCDERVDMSECLGLTNQKLTPLHVLIRPRLPPECYGAVN